MKKAQTLFLSVAAVAIIAVIGGACLYHNLTRNNNDSHVYPTTQYGAFLAAQHAIYVNDFERAAGFANTLTDTDYDKVISFLNSLAAEEEPF